MSDAYLTIYGGFVGAKTPFLGHTILIIHLTFYECSVAGSREDTMEKLLAQMNDVLQEQQQQQRTIIAAAFSTHAAQNNFTAPRNEFGNNEIERLPNERDALRIRKLQEETKKLQEEYAYRSRELAEKEENLLLDIRDFKKLQKADTEKKHAKKNLSSTDDMASLKPHSDNAVRNLWEKSRTASVLIIKSTLQKGNYQRFVSVKFKEIGIPTRFYKSIKHDYKVLKSCKY